MAIATSSKKRYHCFCLELSGEQLARGRLTVEVTVKTLEGYYVGETEYTYIANVLEHFEMCVRALDDEHMETEFSGTSDETVLLNYNGKRTIFFASRLESFAQEILFDASVA